MVAPKLNYVPEAMGFLEGFYGYKGHRFNGYAMVVSESKAKKIINKLLADGRFIDFAVLGLDGDWEENSTVVYDGEGFHEYDAYFGSDWATPLLIVYFTDSPSETYECFRKRKVS